MTRSLIQDTAPADRKRIGRAVRPKLAATLILIRDHQGAVEFLMGKRSAGHRFMPGKFVFPGGRVDACDVRAPIATPLCPQILTTIAGHLNERRAGAAAAAAIRETYEETGLKLARTLREPSRAPKPYQAFADNQLGLDLSALSLLARAITPPYHPKRFDTWFFTARADTLIDDPADLASGELEQLQWVSLAQTADLDLPLITRAVLQDLQEQFRNPETPVPFYQTRSRKHIRSFL
jgi:8-oxo-dGTP pyrophosphatase MutT (NUDIX family)